MTARKRKQCRKRINISLTEEGLDILDKQRERMGLTTSAFVEVLLRFWVRNQSVVAQSVESPLADSEANRSVPGESGT